MKKIFFLLSFLFFITITPVFAETYEVQIQSGVAIPGCEKNNKCVIPNELWIQVGDEVKIIQEKTKCANGMAGFVTWEYNEKPFQTLGMVFDKKGSFNFMCPTWPWVNFTVNVGDFRVDTPESVKQYQEQIKKEEQDKRDAIIAENNTPENIKKRYEFVLEGRDKKIEELEGIIDKKEQIILDLKFDIKDLQKKIENLNIIVIEQINVLMKQFSFSIR